MCTFGGKWVNSRYLVFQGGWDRWCRVPSNTLPRQSGCTCEALRVSGIKEQVGGPEGRRKSLIWTKHTQLGPGRSGRSWVYLLSYSIKSWRIFFSPGPQGSLWGGRYCHLMDEETEGQEPTAIMWPSRTRIFPVPIPGLTLLLCSRF